MKCSVHTVNTDGAIDMKKRILLLIESVTWVLCHFRNIRLTEGKSHSMLTRFDCDLSLDVQDPEMKESNIFNNTNFNFLFGLSEDQKKRIKSNSLK